MSAARFDAAMLAARNAILGRDERTCRQAIACAEDALNDVVESADFTVYADRLTAMIDCAGRKFPRAERPSVGASIAKIMREQQCSYSRARSLIFCPDGRRSFRF